MGACVELAWLLIGCWGKSGDGVVSVRISVVLGRLITVYYTHQAQQTKKVEKSE